MVMRVTIGGILSFLTFFSSSTTMVSSDNLQLRRIRQKKRKKKTMHMIQEHLKVTSYDDLKTKALADLANHAWMIVIDENNAQRHMVTQEQWSQWLRFKDHAESALSPQGKNDNEYRTDLISILRHISNATHRNEDELIGQYLNIINSEMNQLEKQDQQFYSKVSQLSLIHI